MSRLRFLFDEHLAHVIQSRLLQLNAEIEILVMGQPFAPPIGTSDEDILLWLERTGYVLITNNRRTMPDHIRTHYDAGHRLPGLFLLKRQARIGQVIEQLYRCGSRPRPKSTWTGSFACPCEGIETILRASVSFGQSG